MSKQAFLVLEDSSIYEGMSFGAETTAYGDVMGVDYGFEAALVKALMAAGLMLPTNGAILLSIADKDKAEALPIIRKFASMGYKLYATEGTAAIIEEAGLSVNMITKKLSQSHPNVVDIIRQGVVHGVVNTITGGRVPLRDGFEIRRIAAERRIACFTSLDTARVVAEALVNGTSDFNVRFLRDYLTPKACCQRT